MAYTKTTWVNGTTPAINATNLNKMETGISMGQGGYIPFSTFTGATDDAKLAAAVSYVASLSYRPPVVLDENRMYTFNNAHPDPPHGWHLTGPLGGIGGNPEQSTKNQSPARVTINYVGTWINLSVTKWNLRYSNIDWYGNTNCTWLNSPTQTLWRLQLGSNGFDGFRNVIGTYSSGCLMTGCDIYGSWDVANGSDTSFHMTGSDNNLFMDGMYIDSPLTTADGRPHLWADYLTKTVIGPVYATAQNRWSGLYVTGSATWGNGLVLAPGSRWEGRNESVPSIGATIRIAGGGLTIYGAAINFGMTNAANGRGDAGQIHQSGGNLVVRDCSHARATAAVDGQDTPFVYSTGGTLAVSGIQTSAQGGNTWTDVPVVQMAGGNLLDADASVRVDPIKERPARVYTGASAPTNPDKGDLWADSGLGGFQVWSGTAWDTTRVS
jgi:hypothetical protein